MKLSLMSISFELLVCFLLLFSPALSYAESLPSKDKLKEEKAYLLSMAPEKVSELQDVERQDLISRYINCYGGLMYENDLQSALELMLKAHQLFPHEKIVTVNLSGSFATLQDYDKSLEYALKTIDETQPQLQKGDEKVLIAMAHNNAANALIKKGQAEKAYEHLKIAIELRPQMASSNYLMGEIACSQEKYSDSILYYKKGFELNEESANPDDYSLYALALGKSEKTGESLKIMQKGAQRFPLYPGMHLNVASMLCVEKRYAEALYELQIERLLFMGTDRYYKKEVDQFLKTVINDATTDLKHPDNEEITLFLKIRGDFTPEAIEKIIDKSVTKPFILYVFLAEAYAGKGNLDKAKSLYEMILSEAPYFVPAYVELGDVYVRLKEGKKADNLYEQAVKLMPDNWKVKEMLKERPDLAPKG